jgi:hypothetical protein
LGPVYATALRDNDALTTGLYLRRMTATASIGALEFDLQTAGVIEWPDLSCVPAGLVEDAPLLVTVVPGLGRLLILDHRSGREAQHCYAELWSPRRLPETELSGLLVLSDGHSPHLPEIAGGLGSLPLGGRRHAELGK